MGRSKNTTTDWWVLYLFDKDGKRHLLTGSDSKKDLYQEAQLKYTGYTEIRMVNRKTFDKNNEYFNLYDERMNA